MPPRPRTPPSEEPRARLVEAAIEQIEQHGLSRLTIREVAAAAGANIAAVNYYFGSKDALVAAALEGTLHHLLADLEEMLKGIASDPKVGFSELLEYLLEGTLRFPRISKAHLHDAFSGDDYSGPFPVRFAPMLTRIRDALQRAVPGLSGTVASRRTVAALSAMFFPGFFSGLFREMSPLESARDRREYAHEVARQMLAPAAKPARSGKPKR
jgi:AcrR family transcriptional regulator